MDREKYNRTRERSDKISSLMGQYLLRGYKMLGSTCEKCDTVLLKFRDEPEYCIGCQEVDAIMNGAEQEASQPVVESPKATAKIPVERVLKDSQQDTNPQVDFASESVRAAMNSLNEKILWASGALLNCSSIEESIRYCELLKSCAEAMKALQDT